MPHWPQRDWIRQPDGWAWPHPQLSVGCPFDLVTIKDTGAWSAYGKVDPLEIVKTGYDVDAYVEWARDNGYPAFDKSLPPAAQQSPGEPKMHTRTSTDNNTPKRHTPGRYRDQPIPVVLRPAIAALDNGATLHQGDEGWLVRRPDGTRDFYSSVAEAIIEGTR